MGTLEEIKNMQQQGRNTNEIIQILQQKGIPENEINSLLSQTKIKEAVTADSIENIYSNSGIESKSNSVMEPSMLAQNQSTQESIISQNNISDQSSYAYTQEYAPQYQNYSGQYAAPYEPYQPATTIGTDTITEIAEQVITEKLSPLREKIDASLDFKTLIETKIEYLDERLKRIEKIIDRLQLSVLQKVGDYITNVEEIKKELIETQQSFKSLLNSKQKE